MLQKQLRGDPRRHSQAHVYANTCPQNYKFTGKERDPDTASDYFGARFYRYTMARFYSPDWSASVEPVPYAKLDNPQSLNLYTYVVDNPLRYTDADGHDMEGAGGSDSVSGTADTGQGAPGDPAQNKTQTQTQTQQSQQDPNQPVLMAQNRTPATGTPDTTVTLPGQGGNSTDRTYGPDGRAVKDVDSGHDHGAGDPHAHDWDWSKNPPRQPGRPLTPDEAAGKKQGSTMMDKMKSITPGPILKLGTAGVVIYIIIDEGSRLYPPRNLVPVP